MGYNVLILFFRSAFVCLFVCIILCVCMSVVCVNDKIY